HPDHPLPLAVRGDPALRIAELPRRSGWLVNTHLRRPGGRLSAVAQRSAVGAQRKHVTLPADFRSPSVNGHSCYGHLTARFAPKRSSSSAPRNAWVGVERRHSGL